MNFRFSNLSCGSYGIISVACHCLAFCKLRTINHLFLQLPSCREYIVKSQCFVCNVFFMSNFKIPAILTLQNSSKSKNLIVMFISACRVWFLTVFSIAIFYFNGNYSICGFKSFVGAGIAQSLLRLVTGWRSRNRVSIPRRGKRFFSFPQRHNKPWSSSRRYPGLFTGNESAGV
jgi:hypothetical protein